MQGIPGKLIHSGDPEQAFWDDFPWPDENGQTLRSLNTLKNEVRGLKVFFSLATPSKSRKSPQKARNAGIAKENRLSNPQLRYSLLTFSLLI